MKNKQTFGKVWSFESNQYGSKISRRVKKLVDVDAPKYRMLLKMVVYRLVIKCVNKRKTEGINVIHGGGMKR